MIVAPTRPNLCPCAVCRPRPRADLVEWTEAKRRLAAVERELAAARHALATALFHLRYWRALAEDEAEHPIEPPGGTDGSVVAARAISESDVAALVDAARAVIGCVPVWALRQGIGGHVPAVTGGVLHDALRAWEKQE